ncbi:MAG: hypothetical protein ABEN55_13550 [Bradymonadaceae bacterium]
MTEPMFKIIGALVTFLAGLFGGSGGVLWYLDQRADREHEAEQSELDRLQARVGRLEQLVGEQRDELQTQHTKIVEQGRKIADLYEKKSKWKAKAAELGAEVSDA